MQARGWFQFRENHLGNGLRLALLNSVLAVFCILSFLGTLGAVTLLSTWRALVIGDQSAYMPFPYPVLLLLYVALFIIAWVRFGRRLRGARGQIFWTALVGALPLFGLSLLGYASVAWMLVFGDSSGNSMLVARVWVYGMISSLILLSGLFCVTLVTWIGGRQTG